MSGRTHDARNELARLFEEYRSLPMPKAGYAIAELQDADVDLSEEDSYLAGLVMTYINSGHIDVRSITIDPTDPTIDKRLEGAKLASKTDPMTLQAFADYRERMLELAHALERATGVPIQAR